VHYDLRDHREQGTGDQSSLPSSARHPDEEVTLSGEEVSLSFRTSQRPALLLLVSSSHHQEYLALLISQDGRSPAVGCHGWLVQVAKNIPFKGGLLDHPV